MGSILLRKVRTIGKINKKEVIVKTLYILILILTFWKAYTILNEFTNEYGKLLVKVNQLEEQKQELTDKKELLEEILERNRKEKEVLTLQLEDLKEENEQLRTIRAKLTAYSPLDDVDGNQSEGNPNRTSIGKQVSRGIVAADSRKLPYGTKLEIPNWGVVEVGDTGGALRRDKKNIRIDLFHETYPDAIEFGVKDMEVKILEWGGD